MQSFRGYNSTIQQMLSRNHDEGGGCVGSERKRAENGAAKAFLATTPRENAPWILLNSRWMDGSVPPQVPKPPPPQEQQPQRSSITGKQKFSSHYSIGKFKIACKFQYWNYSSRRFFRVGGMEWMLLIEEDAGKFAYLLIAY